MSKLLARVFHKSPGAAARPMDRRRIPKHVQAVPHSRGGLGEQRCGRVMIQVAVRGVGHEGF